jgi:paraquat-inducible protein B
VSAPTNHWKLGAFVLGSSLLALVAAVLLAAQTMQAVTVTYVSYLDEAVTGLAVGSPVTFRGVQIGNVSTIAVAPDRRHVEVSYSLGVEVLARLGLAKPGRGQETRLAVPPDLRVQLASTGLTGTKFLQLDFFETAGAPPPTLPFPVPDHTIPVTPSTMKNLEASVVRAVEQLPDLVRELTQVAAGVNRAVEDVNSRGLPARAEVSLASLNRLLERLQALLDELPVAQLARDAALTLEGANRVLARLDGERGVLASVQRSSDLVGDLAGPRLGPSLEATARDLSEAAVAVRRLAEALQRDPDMLLKGKAKVLP